MIEILLSTWNGEKYLKELIDSILVQTYSDWNLLIRDDGSRDSTIRLIEEYAAQYPEKIRFIQDTLGNLRSTKSFEALLKASTAEYIMFCDQDDFWLPEKIAKTFAEMKRIEKAGVPAAVFTDLKVTDEKLNVTADSFERSQRMFPDAVREKYRCLAHSAAAGCTMMLNRAAVEKVLPIPGELIHDHWCISIVSACGTVSYLDEPTILYRQHGNNVVGTDEVNAGYFLRRILCFRKSLHAFRVLKQNFPFPFSTWKWFYFKFYYALKRSFRYGK